MGEDITFENGQISDFQALVTLTLTWYPVILHTIMHHSSTSVYIEIEETLVDGRTGLTLLGRVVDSEEST